MKHRSGWNLKSHFSLVGNFFGGRIRPSITEMTNDAARQEVGQSLTMVFV